MLERDGELAALDAALAEMGTLVVVGGPAGIGKSSLIRAAQARADGCTILQATGAEFEREFAFGIVQQLFGRVVRTRGVPAGAAAVFDPLAMPEASHAILNGLYWLCAELAEQDPLLLTIDDTQWADEPSLRFLEFLARRLDGLPIVVIAGERPGGATLEPLAGRTLTLAPLSTRAVETLLCERGMEPTPAFVDAVAQTTGGNPMLLDELTRALDGVTGTDADADAARTAVPGSLVRSVAARLEREGEDAIRVAHAIAVLGDRTRLDRVAKLAGTTEPIDALVRAGILAGDHLGFVHPMIREAVEIPPARCAALHRAAAEILQRDNERDAAIALHLLHAEPAGDPEAAALLQRAGERAAAEGAPALARTLLARALAEPPRDRTPILLALGGVEVELGAMADALDHLQQVVDAGDPVLRARAELARSNLMNSLDRQVETAANLRAAIDALGDRDEALQTRLLEQLLEAQHYAPELRPERTALLNGLDPATAPRPLLGHLAFQRAVTDGTREEVVAIARRAYAEGRLFEDFNWGRATPFWLNVALATVEAADVQREFLQVATRAAARTGSPFSQVYVAMCRATFEWRFGDLRRAEEEARTGLEAFRATGLARAIEHCSTVVAQTRLDQGDTDGADALLAEATTWTAWMVGRHSVRARVRLAQGRPQEALESLERQFALEREAGWRRSPFEHTRARRTC